MTTLHIRDISKYQGSSPDIAGYVKAGNHALIVRAHNGYEVDSSFARNRKAAHTAKITELGIYQYLAKDVAVATQANAFLKAVGTWAPNEFPVLDLEEGSGSQAARAEAWFKIVDKAVGDRTKSVLYTGLAYGPAHGLDSLLKEHLGIVAAYRTSPEPTQGQAPHSLWQHSNGSTPPHKDAHLGAVDCSIFHGSIAQLTALLHPEANMTLTATDVDKVADKTLAGLQAAFLEIRIADPVKDDKTTTNVNTLLRTLRRQVNILASAKLPTATEIAAAVTAGLPPAATGGLTKADVQAAVVAALASLFDPPEDDETS